jgi:hypothetical protein
MARIAFQYLPVQDCRIVQPAGLVQFHRLLQYGGKCGLL